MFKNIFSVSVFVALIVLPIVPIQAEEETPVGISLEEKLSNLGRTPYRSRWSQRLNRRSTENETSEFEEQKQSMIEETLAPYQTDDLSEGVIAARKKIQALQSSNRSRLLNRLENRENDDLTSRRSGSIYGRRDHRALLQQYYEEKSYRGLRSRKLDRYQSYGNDDTEN